MTHHCLNVYDPYLDSEILLDFCFSANNSEYAISLKKHCISIVKYVTKSAINDKELELIMTCDLKHFPFLLPNTYGWVSGMTSISFIKSFLFLSSLDTFTLCNIVLNGDSDPFIQVEVWPLQFPATYLYPTINGAVLSHEKDGHLISYYVPNVISPWERLDFHYNYDKILFVSTITSLSWIILYVQNSENSPHFSIFYYKFDKENPKMILEHVVDIPFTFTSHFTFHPIRHLLTNEMMLYFVNSNTDLSLYLITPQFNCIKLASSVVVCKSLKWTINDDSNRLLLCKDSSGYLLFIGGFESLSISISWISKIPFPLDKNDALHDILSLLAISLPFHVFADLLTHCISFSGSIINGLCSVFESYSFPCASISRIKLGLLLLKEERSFKSLSSSTLDELLSINLDNNSSNFRNHLPIQGNFLDIHPFITPNINKWCFSMLSSSSTGMIYDSICNEPLKSQVFELFNISFDFCRLFHSCIFHQYSLFADRLDVFLNSYCSHSNVLSLKRFPFHMILPIYHFWWYMSRNPSTIAKSSNNWSRLISLFDRNDLDIKCSDQIGPGNKYRFAQDNRLHTVYHSLLDPSNITIVQSNPDIIEDSAILIEQQSIVMENLYRKLSQPFGFALFMMDTINGDDDIIVDTETIKSFSLFNPITINISVKFSTHTSSPEPNSFPPDWMDIPMYWNGLGQGLRRIRIDSSSYSLPMFFERANEMNQDVHGILMHVLTKNLYSWSSGLLFSLGLQGYFKNGSEEHVQLYYELLAIGSPWLSNNLLLSLAASNIGTMNRLITKLCCLHCPSMMVQEGSIDDSHYADERRISEKQSSYSFSYLKSSISPVIIPHPSMSLGAIASLGLLYCGTGHERMSMILLNELESIWLCSRSSLVNIPKSKDKKSPKISNIESFYETFSSGLNGTSNEHKRSTSSHGPWSVESQGYTIAIALGWIHLGRGKIPKGEEAPWATKLLNWSNIQNTYNYKTLSSIPCLVSLCLQYYNTKNVHIMSHMKDRIQYALKQRMSGEYIFYSTLCYYMASRPDEKQISIFDIISNDHLSSHMNVFMSMTGLTKKDLIDWNIEDDMDPLESTEIGHRVVGTFHNDELHSEQEHEVFTQTLYLASGTIFYIGLRWAGSRNMELYKHLSIMLRVFYEDILSKPVILGQLSLRKRQRLSVLMYFVDLILLALCLIMSGSGHLPLLRVIHGLLKQEARVDKESSLYYPLYNRHMSSLELVHSCLGFLLSCQGTRTLDTGDDKRMAALFTSLLPFIYSFPVKIEPPNVFSQMNQSLWNLVPSLQHLQSASSTSNTDSGLFSGPGPLPFLRGLCALAWKHNERLLLVCQENNEEYIKFLNVEINVIDSFDKRRETVMTTPCFIEQQSSIGNKKWIEWKPSTVSKISFSSPYRNTTLPSSELFCIGTLGTNHHIRNLHMSRTEHLPWLYKEGCYNAIDGDGDSTCYYALANNPLHRRKYPINVDQKGTCMLDDSCCIHWDALIQEAALYDGVLRYWKEELYFMHILCHHPSLSDEHVPDQECLFGYLLWKRRSNLSGHIIPETLLLKYILMNKQ